MKLSRWTANLLLLLTAFIWGTTFVPQKTAMLHISPLFFTGLRFAIGCICLYPAIKILRQLDQRPTRSINKAEWKYGILLGLLMFVGISLQQIGIVHTTVAKASFITGLYVVLVPLLGFYFGEKPSLITISAAALAFVGLYLLTVPADLAFDSTARGDVFVLISALAWAGHVIAVGKFSHKGNALHLSFVQFLTTAILALCAAFIFEIPAFGKIQLVWVELLYAGILSVSVAFTLQVIGQQSTPPTAAAIILSLEAVFAVLAGWLYLQDAISSRDLIGICLMFIAMLASQLLPTSTKTVTN
jgi:drug/metabolite transporter (DMT)-like permease